MQFSLWMIQELFRDVQTQLRLRETERRTIRNIRLYNGGVMSDRQSLYIESSEVFFQDNDRAAVCVHGDNVLWIRSLTVNEVFNRVLEFFEACQLREQKLNRMITSNCLLKDILNDFCDVIPLPLMVLDNGQMILATSENYGPGTIDPEWDVGLQTGRFQTQTLNAYNTLYLDKVKERGFYEVPADPFPYPSFNRNIFLGHEFVGFISMILVRENREVYKDWFDIACAAIMDWIALYMQQNEILLRQKIFSELLDGDLSHAAQFTNTMETYGWKPENRKRLLVLHCISNVLNMNQLMSKVLNRESPAIYAMEYQNEIVAAVNDSLIPPDRFSGEILPLFRNNGYYGGVSDSFSDFGNLFQYYLQAKTALRHGQAHAGSLHHIKDHMVPYIFQWLTSRNRLDMRHPALAEIREYDRLHGSGCYEILRVYLQSGCSQTAAAEALYLHRNTLIRKIEKIQKLFHIDLGSYEIRLHLMMSFEMDKIEADGANHYHTVPAERE